MKKTKKRRDLQLKKPTGFIQRRNKSDYNQKS